MSANKSKIMIITDAWLPQTNGAVTAVMELSKALQNKGYEVVVIHPGLFNALALPLYDEVKIAITPWQLMNYINHHKPDYIYIPVEGPLGITASMYLSMKHRSYVTAVGTRFAEYSDVYFGFGSSVVYRFMRLFHNQASVTFINTQSQKEELVFRGFTGLRTWSLGVNRTIFKPLLTTPSRPYALYVGRISKDKNIRAFLNAATHLDKIVVGDGPKLADYRERYPAVKFVGKKQGHELARFYQHATVLVFPSLLDTFGLVIVESIACGTPVVAYNVSGPKDIIIHGLNGYLVEPHLDLSSAINDAVNLSRQATYQSSLKYNWSDAADQLLMALRNTH
ncbi:MAG: glycosyltransferase [Pseudomonadota bacterium]|nr:glycosyltransferase [Pseudomonadota bacterium]